MIFRLLVSIIFVFITANLAQVPTNVRIVATDKDFIRLSWSKPDRTPAVHGYTIKYRPIHSNQSWIVRQTDATQILLNELRPITKYEIILQAYANSSYTDSSGPSTRIEAITDETGNFLFSGFISV
ncbi:unnamed protein product [Adineta ricciae]|uniref:Fibronectin type-III domain-containing protein n=1 Tax=Adineta ricciae TaxID=249248 RepID=A0A814RJA7_ADIRI|nr:unnamed protein product [Adineta ricciae]